MRAHEPRSAESGESPGSGRPRSGRARPGQVPSASGPAAGPEPLTQAPPGSTPSDPATLVVGLLGGVASGKSTVGRVLAGADGELLSADLLAREVLESPEVVDRLRGRFGAEALGPDGRPDREFLARRVFSDPQARADLEGWIHPRVRATIRARLERARAGGVPIVALDVPLLLEHEAEHGLGAECDTLVFVDSPHESREARARSDRGWEPGEVARRERAQMPLDEKRRRADHVISNKGTREELEREAVRLRERLLDLPHRP